ncbi:MAG: hypothetical protein R3229_11385 [Alphaproteobacteria bacterium]|nr:hypothetical protein [Alphaproteobacteria bacterium]
MGRFTPLLLIFVLAGCAMPPAVTMLSLAADGVSYVATGKGTTDHALSALAGEDCALVRAVKEEAICRPVGAVLVGAIEAPSPDPAPSLEDATDIGPE